MTLSLGAFGFLRRKRGASDNSMRAGILSRRSVFASGFRSAWAGLIDGEVDEDQTRGQETDPICKRESVDAYHHDKDAQPPPLRCPRTEAFRRPDPPAGLRFSAMAHA